MSKVINTKLSKEAKNRILIWREALHKAYFNIKAKEHIESNIGIADNNCSFIFAKGPCYVHTSFAASEALINYSIILIRQVFTTGDEGVGIAKNQGNIEVDNFRTNMLQYVRLKLNWSEKELQEFNAFLRDNRNQLVAHYSGSNAEYEEIPSDIASRKMIGAHINNSDIEKLKIYIEEMCNYINETLLLIS